MNEEPVPPAGGAPAPPSRAVSVPGGSVPPGEELPLLPGFREMALRRMSGERQRMVAGLAARRQAAGLSQTEVAARMGTSQSAVARLESGTGDVRASTLERYAAAVGRQISWQVRAAAGPAIHPAGANEGSHHDDPA